MAQATVTEFEDSLEATEFMEKLQGMLEDPRLKNWAKITDENYGTETLASLRLTKLAYDEFIDAMHNAE